MRVRYVAGLGVEVTESGPVPRYHVVRIVEDDEGNRTAGPVFVIGDMNAEQAEHLWVQLGNALGKRMAPDLWPSSALRAALDYHRAHEGVEVEINDEGGWRDVRSYLPEP